MKHRDRFTTPEDLAAYDDGYRKGLDREEIDLPKVGTREEMVRKFILMVGVIDGLQDSLKRRGGSQ